MEQRIERRSELNGIIEKALEEIASVDELIDKLRKAGVPCSPVMTLAEILEAPHVKDRGILWPLNHPQYGPILQTRTPIVRSGKMPEARSGAPLLGQHTREVLAELKYQASEIEDLLSSGAAVPVKEKR